MVMSDEDWHYFKIQGPLIVNEKFKDMTEVKFFFKYYSEVLEVTKTWIPQLGSCCQVLEVSKTWIPMLYQFGSYLLYHKKDIRQYSAMTKSDHRKNAGKGKSTFVQTC